MQTTSTRTSGTVVPAPVPAPVYSVWTDREIVDRLLFLDRMRRDGVEVDMQDREAVGIEMTARELW